MDFQQLIGYNNQGYRIIKAEVYKEENGRVDGICLGVNANGTMFVSWDFCAVPGQAPSFNTGHYISSGQPKALAEYHDRLREKYDTWGYRPLMIPYNV